MASTFFSKAPLPSRRGWHLALVAVAFAVASSVLGAGRFAGIDFYQFWTVGQAAREFRGQDVYSSEARQTLGAEYARRSLADVKPGAGPQELPPRALAAGQRQVLETYSTPWLYTLFGAFSSGEYGLDKRRFQWLSTLALALGVLAMARAAGASPEGASLMAVLALTAFAPSDSCSRVGNVNRLQLGGLALALWSLAGAARARALVGGAVLGLLAAFKPNLAFAPVGLGIGWVATANWARLVWTALGVLVGLGLSFAGSSWWFGSANAWPRWSGVLSELMQRYDSPIAKGNLSLVRALESLGVTLSSNVLLICLWLCLILCVWLGRAGLRARLAGSAASRGSAQLLLVGASLAISVLAVDLAWLHYFVLLLPLGLELCFETSGLRRTMVVLALSLLSLYVPRALFGFAENSPPAAWCASGGALLLFGLALHALARGGRGLARSAAQLATGPIQDAER